MSHLIRIKQLALAVLLGAAVVLGSAQHVFAQSAVDAVAPADRGGAGALPAVVPAASTQPRAITVLGGGVTSVIVLPPIVPAATADLPSVAAPQQVVTDPGIVGAGPLDNPQIPGRGFDADMAPFRS
jgi:hypothetical protein